MKKLMKKNLAIVLLVIALLVTFATFLYIFKFTNINVFKNVETETKLALQETSNRKAQKFNTFKTLTNLANDAEEGYTIAYDMEDPTNQNVTATIYFLKENVTITNNDGNNTHTFEENGEFIFEFVDEEGNAGTATAKVNWIYKEAPQASILYSTTELTNQDVTAEVYFKDIEIFVFIVNDKYTFEENGEHTFYYEDEAGNTGSITAVVDWIDKDAPVATIEYSEEDPTNQDVVATISFDEENVTITNNDGNNTYTFTDKGEFIFEFVDKAGNTGTAKAKVDWIYKKAPEASIKYSTTELTNQDVTAQVYFKDVEIFVVIANDEYTFTENGTHTFYYEDEAGNTGSITAEVTWIRKEAPVGTIKYSTTNPTNQDVTATIVFDEDEVRVIGGETHTFTKNGKYTFEYVDSLGNVGKQVAEVDWIDKEAPEATITYDIEELTNQNVTATISFNEENVTVTNNAASTTYTFEENDTFTFEFVDAAGNTGTATAEVDWIDKVPPIATIEYDIEDLTNEDVIATISFDKDYVEITNNDGEDYYVFEENGEFTFEYVDEAGNTGSATATVDWIDKVAPVGTITYDIIDITNQDVTATITFDEENVTITNNGGDNIFVFEENDEFTFEFEDEAGNVGELTAIVNWIDKEAPEATIEYDIEELTNQNVTATISFNEENVTITNNEGSPTYTFEENNEFTFEFVDAAGNVGEITAEVDWIDKELPEATIEYSETKETKNPVIARVVNPTKDITIVNNNGLDTYKFVRNGSFTFIIEDSLGNRNEITATVDWIDSREADSEVTSAEYKIEKPYIKNVQAGTKVSEFKSKLSAVAEIVVKDKKGNIAKEDEAVTTGMKVIAGINEYTVVVLGDVDGNGQVTITDLAKLCLHYIGKEELVGAYKEAADLDNNNEITITDLAKLELILVDKNQ